MPDTELMPRVETPAEERMPIGYVDGLQQRCAQIEALLKSRDVVFPKEHRARLLGQRDALRTALRAVAVGFEPFSPPTTWYAGLLPEDICGPKVRANIPGDIRLDREFAPYTGWPSAGPDPVVVDKDLWQVRTLRFSAPIPSWAVPRIKLAAKICGKDNLAAYSPVASDFITEITPMPCEPLVAARVSMGGEWHYFEVARWDVARDLAAMYDAASGDNSPDAS